MTALTPDNRLHVEHTRRIDDALVDLLQVMEVEEEPKIPAFVAIGTGGPANPQKVEELGVADHSVHVGEVVGRRRNQEDIGTIIIYREGEENARLLLDVLFQEFAVVYPGGGRDAQVVAQLIDFGHHLGNILGGDPDTGHNLTGGHGNLGGVNAIGAEDGAAPALRALVKIRIPLL